MLTPTDGMGGPSFASDVAALRTHASRLAPEHARWTEVAFALRPEGESRVPHRDILESLYAFVDAERAAGRLALFYFMAKPPGFRLRFARTPEGATLAEAVRTWLSTPLVQRSAAVAVVTAYEPEAFQFGGRRAMELVHRYFDSDSRAYWEGHRSKLANEPFSVERLSANALNALFLDSSNSPEEAWDVWCHLSEINGISICSEVEESLRAHGLLDAPPPPLAVAARELATGLRALQRDGELLFLRTEILPFVGLFQWNRFVLPRAARARICRSMTSYLCPKHRERAATP